MLLPFNPIDSTTGSTLYPDLNADEVRDPKYLRKEPLFQQIFTAVRTAVDLHTDIRTSTDRVYYWDPLYKGSEFDPETMTCANLYPTQQSSPFNEDADTGEDVEDFSYHTKALVRVVCFHGLTCYRKGGGDLAEKTLEMEKLPGYFDKGGPGYSLWGKKTVRPGDRERTTKDGFRSRVLAKGIVALCWGKQRKFASPLKGRKDTAAEDMNDDGHVELLDLARKEVMEMQKEGKGNGGCGMM